jgi:hypothetical protein
MICQFSGYQQCNRIIFYAMDGCLLRIEFSGSFLSSQFRFTVNVTQRDDLPQLTNNGNSSFISSKILLYVQYICYFNRSCIFAKTRLSMYPVNPMKGLPRMRRLLLMQASFLYNGNAEACVKTYLKSL